MNKHLILFDGICNLCNGAVRFIIKRDKRAVFQFASFQSAFAKKVISNYKLPNVPDSVLLVKENNIFYKSEAAFEIIKSFSKPWQILLIFNLFPKTFTDLIYDFIAKHRYKIFGKKNKCPIPEKSIADRFIDE